MQGASFTSARIEVTRDQMAHAPMRRIEVNAVSDELGFAIRRVKGAPATYIIVGRRAPRNPPKSSLSQLPGDRKARDVCPTLTTI